MRLRHNKMWWCVPVLHYFLWSWYRRIKVFREKKPILILKDYVFLDLTQLLYNNWEHTVRCRDGSIEGWEWDYLAPTFLVEPGRYCGIQYNEKPGGSDTAFCIMVYSAVPLQIKWVTSHPVWYIFSLFSRYCKCSFFLYKCSHKV